MNCLHCNAEIPVDSVLCPSCGRCIDHSNSSVVRLDFGGTAGQLAGYMLLSAVASLVIIPLAWVNVAIQRWFCRNLKFSDGSSASFAGKGEQIVGWFILYITIVVGFQVLNFKIPDSAIGSRLLLLAGYALAITGIGLILLRWTVSKVELSIGPKLSFEGTYGEFIGWYALLLLSFLTVIGWAWASAGMYRWMARSTRGSGIQFAFHGKGHQLLWRTLVCGLLCLFIIPIPWMIIALMQWVVENITMTRSAVESVVAA